MRLIHAKLFPSILSVAERLLTIENLDVSFGQGPHKSEAVRSVNVTIDRGQTVALVGESGSGKSVTALSVMQLLPYPMAQHPNGSIRYRDQELVGAGPTVMQSVRGNQISMIFQEPMTSLNPLHTIDRQISESLKLQQNYFHATGSLRMPKVVCKKSKVKVLSGNSLYLSRVNHLATQAEP